MAADYNINLAKDLTSSSEERTKFYNGMIIYLALCAIGLVFAAYLTSINLKGYTVNKREQKVLLSTASSVFGLDVSAFKSPGKTYEKVEAYSKTLASLKTVLGNRVQLLPVVHNLFIDLPDGVVLQTMSATKEKLTFGLTMPPPSEKAGDPVRDLRKAWEANEELMNRVGSIRPVTGERRTMGSQSVFYVKFECVLKK